jgi:hypothetical protein
MYMLKTSLRIKRKVLALLEKVLDNLDRGIRLAAVGQHNNVNLLMILFTNENEDMNRGSIVASALLGAKISCVIHHGPFV